MATESFQSQKRSLPLWWREPPAGQKTEKQTNLSPLQSTINPDRNQFSQKVKKKTDLQHWVGAEQKTSCIQKASFQRQLWKAAKNFMVLPTRLCQKKRVEPVGRKIPAWRKKLLRSFLPFFVLRLATTEIVVLIVPRSSVIQICLCFAMASLIFGDDAGSVDVHN